MLPLLLDSRGANVKGPDGTVLYSDLLIAVDHLATFVDAIRAEILDRLGDS